jgi:uncharacterized membrane protein YeaQ/YmgE (transglycosylase-associated protein family)
MGLFSTIIVGLIAGWLASKVMKTETGLWTNLILGVVGGVLGGWISTLFTGLDLVTGVNLTSIIVALLGAILVIALYRFFRRK